MPTRDHYEQVTRPEAEAAIELSGGLDQINYSVNRISNRHWNWTVAPRHPRNGRIFKTILNSYCHPCFCPRCL